MSAISVTSSAVLPAVVASGASAGTAGATSLAVHTLPTTGAGLTLLLVIMAITFILVGTMLLWNPLNRRPGKLVSNGISPGHGQHAIAHTPISG